MLGTTPVVAKRAVGRAKAEGRNLPISDLSGGLQAKQGAKYRKHVLVCARSEMGTSFVKRFGVSTLRVQAVGGSRDSHDQPEKPRPVEGPPGNQYVRSLSWNTHQGQDRHPQARHVAFLLLRMVLSRSAS